jgi:hypothetical protein
MIAKRVLLVLAAASCLTVRPLYAETDVLSEVMAENEASSELLRQIEEKMAEKEDAEPFADLLNAEEEPVAPEVPKGPSFLVIVPERVEVEWYWYFYTDESQHIVQSEIEKRLVRDGHTVLEIGGEEMLGVDLTLENILKRQTALDVAKRLGATHLIHGQATAAPASHSVAYGVNVYRSDADIQVRVVRVADGKVLAVEDASATGGSEAQKAAGRAGLKDAGKKLAKKVGRAVDKILQGADES